MTDKRSVRAAPRRAKKDGEAPVFLQKTFAMINACPSAVAGWSANGDTFIVKDNDAFANQLPKYFKHNNFRSFVRQLNFYGFRKLRTDGALISERPASWWEFRHEKFIRGRPELLREIKRANHYETATSDQAEVVEDLKSEVSMLKNRIEEMGSTIEHLTGLVDKLMLDRQHQQEQQEQQPCCDQPATPKQDGPKKRRLQQPKLQEQVSIDLLRTFEGPEDAVSDEVEMLSQLSLDSGVSEDFDSSLSMFDFALDSSPVPHTEPATVSDSDLPVAVSVPLPPPTAAAAVTAAAAAATATAGPSPALTTDSGAAFAEMPPVAPYLAQAAIGAFITKLAETSKHTTPAASAMEGAPLMRTMSSSSMVVSA